MKHYRTELSLVGIILLAVFIAVSMTGKSGQTHGNTKSGQEAISKATPSQGWGSSNSKPLNSTNYLQPTLTSEQMQPTVQAEQIQ